MESRRQELVLMLKVYRRQLGEIVAGKPKNVSKLASRVQVLMWFLALTLSLFVSIFLPSYYLDTAL